MLHVTQLGCFYFLFSPARGDRHQIVHDLFWTELVDIMSSCLKDRCEKAYSQSLNLVALIWPHPSSLADAVVPSSWTAELSFDDT